MKFELLQLTDDPGFVHVVWKCPGCKCSQGVPVRNSPRAWGWNESFDKPTLSPSVLIDFEDSPRLDRPRRCHSVIVDGMIQFCGDSTHEYAGMTVEIPDFDERPKE